MSLEDKLWKRIQAYYLGEMDIDYKININPQIKLIIRELEDPDMRSYVLEGFPDLQKTHPEYFI
jgi:hypothetical protein